MEYMREVNEILKEDGPINDYVDLKEQLKDVLVRSGREAAIKNKEEMEEALERRRSMAVAALEERRAAARKEMGNASSALRLAQQGESGPPSQDGQGELRGIAGSPQGGQTPGGQGAEAL